MRMREGLCRVSTESCLNRIIFFREPSLRRAVHEFVAHYHDERNHQGLGNRLILPEPSRFEKVRAIRRPERLGGTLNTTNRSGSLDQAIEYSDLTGWRHLGSFSGTPSACARGALSRKRGSGWLVYRSYQ